MELHAENPDKNPLREDQFVSVYNCKRSIGIYQIYSVEESRDVGN